MSKRCSFCILPVNLPGLTLDQNGKCNYCRESETSYTDKSHLPHDHTEDKLQALLEQLRGKGKYDCLVPLSGGKDSSYVLYVLVKKYNMKALAYNFDNGFRHNQAVRNIENLVNQLGVDLVVYKPGQNMMHELFKIFLSRAGEFCTPCNMFINATAYRLARQNNIQAIMSGTLPKLQSSLEGVSPSRYYDRKYYLNVAKGLISRSERDYYTVPPYCLTAIRRLIGRGPTVINVLNYFRPKVTQIRNELQEIGWESPGGAIEHGDCLLPPIKDYLQYKKWGYSEVTGLYSLLARNGEITREEALRRALDEEPNEAPPILPEFLKAIGMTESEFNEALKRDFREIPNLRSSGFFQLAKKVVHKIEQVRGRR